MARQPSFPILYDEVKTLDITSVKKSLKNIGNSRPFVLLQYYWKGQQVTDRIELASVPSNLGKGRIWYFVCPSTGKRCSKLYFIRGKYYHRDAFFGCMYSIQTKSHRWRQLMPLLDVIFRCGKFDLRRKYFKKYYKGKPTKRFLGLIEKATKILKEKRHVGERFL